MADEKHTFLTGIQSAETRAGLHDVAAETANVMRDTTDAVSDQARQMTDDFARAGEQGTAFAQQSMRGFSAMTDATRVLASSVQELTREVMAVAQDGLRYQIDGMTTLGSCRTLPELMAAQNGFARQSIEHFFEGQRRIAEITLRVAGQAREQMNRGMEEGVDAARQATSAAQAA